MKYNKKLITDLFGQYRSSDFLKNVFHLVSGTTIAQLIPILLQPVLRRIYTPADFGAFAIYFNVMSVLAVFLTLRYEQAIVIAENDTEATNVLSLAGMFALIFSSLLAILLFIFFNSVQVLLDFPLTHISWLYFLPLSAFLFSIYEALNYWLIRKKAFKSSALNKISRRSVEGGVQALFGFRHNVFGLFIGDICGNMVNVISAVFQIKRKSFTMAKVSRSKMAAALKRYSHFPKYNLIPTLLNAASLAIPLLLINKLFDPVQVGYIDLSRQVLAVPLALISITIGQVLLQRLAQKRNDKLSILFDLKSLFLGLAVTAVLEIIIILFFGEFLFGIVFGKSWIISGSYSKILVFSYSVKFVMTTLSIAFIALEKIKLIAIWQVSYFCAILLLFFVRNISVVQFLGLYVIIELVSYSIYFGLLVNTVKKYEKGLLELNQDNHQLRNKL